MLTNQRDNLNTINEYKFEIPEDVLKARRQLRILEKEKKCFVNENHIADLKRLIKLRGF